MPTFTGTSGEDTITPDLVSAGVIAAGGAAPTSAADTLSGGGGNDTLDGGGGGDSISAGDGNDLINFAPTALSDSLTVNGGNGKDVLDVTPPADGTPWDFGFQMASGHAELALTQLANSIAIDSVNVENIQLDASHLGRTQFTLTSGAQNIVALQLGTQLIVEGAGFPSVLLNNLAAATPLTITTGDGNDTIDVSRLGLSGHAQVLDSGAGNDTLFVTNSTVFAGDGDDVINWMRGGADSIHGGAGNDVQNIVTGGNTDTIILGVNGTHVIETLNGQPQDVVGVETINIATLDRADTITVGDLTDTDVKTVNIKLAGSTGAPDGAVDTVNLTAPGDAQVLTTHGADGTSEQITYSVAGVVVETINITGMDATDVAHVSSVAARTDNVFTATGANDVFTWVVGDGPETIDGGAGIDTLNLVGGAGNDFFLLQDGVDNSPLPTFTNFETLTVSMGDGDDAFLAPIAATIRLDGGAGNDELFGGTAADTITGDSGNDIIDGNQANDQIDAGDNDDLIIVNANFDTEGSDVIDGGRGSDTVRFEGTDNHQTIAIGPSGGHAILTRDADGVREDLTGVEKIEVLAGGGGDDFVTINDLTGTDVKEVDVSFLVGGRPDGLADSVLLFASNKDTHLDISSFDDGTTVVSGMAEKVVVSGYTPGLDVLDLTTGAGNDTVGASVQSTQNMKIEISTGAGNDSLVGGAGDDLLVGGDGSDTLDGELGDDTLLFQAGETGHDVVLGFQPHKGTVDGDTIFLKGFADHSFVDLLNHGHIAQQGNDVIVTTDGTNVIVTIKNTLLSDLGSADFTSDFIPPPPPPDLIF